MKDVGKQTWLWERKETNGTRMFYLRAAVPTDLIDIYGKMEIRKSLRTKDRKEANRLIKAEAALLEEEFERHRREREKVETNNVTRAQLWVLVLQWFRDQYLVQELHNATMELLRRRLARVDGNFDAATDTRFDASMPARPANPTTTASAPGGMTLAELKL